ncbi:MAG: cytochrome c oxidase assembly protein [Gemmobacter sp.]
MIDRTTPYCGPAPAPQDLWLAWNLDPVLLTGLAVFAAAGWGLARDRRALVAALGALVLAFVSPLCAATVALLSARAAHHLVLLSLAAPALALALPLRARVAAPAMAATVAVLAAWHLPGVYAAAWDSAAIYWAMQAALLLPAWAFWSSVLRPAAAEALFARAFLIAGLAGAMGLIGAVLTFARTAFYAEHLVGTAAWGIDPLADQQLAGLVMWVPGFVPLIAVAFLMLRQGWRRGFA